MSGDVQPRKRRDKKKKKDDEEMTAPRAQRGPSLTPLEKDGDDVNIHVHKEGGTGGGMCAKLVFFVLLSALAVLIGLIIAEQRGLTDLDTVEKESRFSAYFEGWVDNAPEEHDDHHDVIDHDEEDDHEEHVDHEEEEEDEEHDHDEEEDHDEEDDHDLVSEEPEEEEEEEEVEKSVQEGTQEEEDEEYEEQGTQEDEEEEEEEEEEESVQDDVEDEEEDQESAALKTEEEEEEEEEADKASEEEEADKASEEEEVDKASEEDEEEEAPGASQGAAADNDEEPEDTEDIAQSEEKADDDALADAEDQPQDAVEDEEVEAVEEAAEEQPISVVKAAVGLVTLAAAYVVLIRKWKSDEAGEAEAALARTKGDVQQDLTRRNTIVVPPKVEEVDLNYEEYSDEEDEGEYDDEEEEEEEYEIKFDRQGQKEYRKLRSTYERSLTPDSERFDKEEAEEEEYDDEELEAEPEEEGEYEYEQGPEEEEEEELEPEEDEEEEEEPISEEDDEELMKKLEAKYGKLSQGQGQPSGEDDYEEDEDQDAQYDDEDYVPEDEDEEDDDGFPWRQGGAQEAATPEEETWRSTPSYDYENITNPEDFAIYEQLDEAQDNLIVNAAAALKRFDAILKSHPRSPRALYGRARALDRLAEERQSNQLLTEAITNYQRLLSASGVPPALYKMAGDRCINRLRFMGQYSKAVDVHRLLIKRFPAEVSHRNQLAVTYLTTNKMEDARRELKQSLRLAPRDGFALVHYGFVLKVHDGDLEAAVRHLQDGIRTRQDGVVDGRFYFHLGDALARLGRRRDAERVYRDGAEQKVFLSARQRSLYNVPALKAQPWWRHLDTPPSYQRFFKLLEGNYERIREEGLSAMRSRGLFRDEAENLRDKGDWKQFELFARGSKHRSNCERCPLTCRLVESLPEAAGCRRGQVKFSVMLPGTHVWPHCGPTNCRLRAHLGLEVPAGTFLRVDRETRSWKEGEVMIFDDSFEHEVWHNGSDFRLVLIVDVWHPELTALERRSLPAI